MNIPEPPPRNRLLPWGALVAAGALGSVAAFAAWSGIFVPLWTLTVLVFLMGCAGLLSVCRVTREAAAERARLQSAAAGRIDNLALDGMSHMTRMGELEGKMSALQERLKTFERRTDREHEVLLLASREVPILAASLIREFGLHPVIAQQHLDDLVRALLLQPHPPPKGGYQLSPKGRSYLREYGLLAEEAAADRLW